MPKTNETNVEQAKLKRRNTIFVEGHLKENALQVISTDKGEAIRGHIVIAVDEHNSFKIQYFVSKRTKNGEEAKEYASLEALLPEKTMSVAQYLQTVPTANFANAANASSKIWAVASIEEFVSKDPEGKEKTMITYRGKRGGIKEGDTFNPRATFKCDVYLEAKKPEVNTEGEETGRINITGLIPAYNGSMYRVNFVTNEGDASNYVNDLYEVGQTVYLEGNIVAVRQEVARTSTKTMGWGTAAALPPKTYFNTQFVICGGSTTPINEDEPGAITKKDVKDGLNVRESEATANYERRANKGGSAQKAEVASTPKTVATPASPKPAAQVKSSFDFSDF